MWTMKARAVAVAAVGFAAVLSLGCLTAHGSGDNISNSVVAASYAAAAAAASILKNWMRTYSNHKEDCFSPYGTLTKTDESSYRVLRHQHEPDDGESPFLRRLEGMYRDKFTLHVSLEMPAAVAADGEGDEEGEEGDEGIETSTRRSQHRALESELVIVTDTKVTRRIGPFESRHEEVGVTYQVVSSLATVSSGHDEDPAWEEMCRARTTTARTVSSGIRSVPRLRRRLSTSASRESAATVNRCAPLLLATAGSGGSSGDELGSAVATDPNFPTSHSAGISPVATTTSRYLGVVPSFPVRIGDSWPVMLPWKGHGDHGGPSLTGVATLLGYRSVSCTKTDPGPPTVAVIQVRGTEAAIDWSLLWGGGHEPDVSENGSSGTTPTAATRTYKKMSVVVGDVDVIANVHFDTSTQVVRHVEADQAFVLHVTSDNFGSGSLPDPVVTTVPVRGTAVLETTQL